MTVDISSEAVERDEVLADLDRLSVEEDDVLSRFAARHIRAQAERIKELEAAHADTLNDLEQARSARDEMEVLAQSARNDALREAAAICDDHRPDRPLAARAKADGIKRDILALIEGDTND